MIPRISCFGSFAKTFLLILNIHIIMFSKSFIIKLALFLEKWTWKCMKWCISMKIHVVLKIVNTVCTLVQILFMQCTKFAVALVR